MNERWTDLYNTVKTFFTEFEEEQIREAFEVVLADFCLLGIAGLLYVSEIERAKMVADIQRLLDEGIPEKALRFGRGETGPSTFASTRLFRPR